MLRHLACGLTLGILLGAPAENAAEYSAEYSAGGPAFGGRPQAVATPALEALIAKNVAEAQEQLEGSLELWSDHSTWENRWRVRSEHYEVHTTQSYAYGKFLADSLESMLPRFEQTAGVEARVSEANPMVVYIFPDLTGYNALGDQYAEHSSFYGSFYANGQEPRVVATYYQDNPTLMRMWLTHSAVHQFLDRAIPGATVPTWIDEGMASYFSLFWGYDYGVDQFESMRNRNQLIGLDTLLAADLGDYSNRPHERLIQIGMLFTYLIHIREDTRTVEVDGEVESQPFVDYLRQRVAGQAAPADPIRKLLFGDHEVLESEFHGFTGWR